MILAASALVRAVWAELDETEAHLRLELNLVDGSRIIGIPSIEAVPVETPYAKMNVPLKQIMTMKIGEDHEAVAFDLQNGDKLKGVINLEPIKLETVFGKVAISIEHIKVLTVMLPGGWMPDVLRNGLVLYYSFDKDENGKVIDKSGKGNHGYWVGAPMYGAGVQGQAARFRSKDTYIVSSAPHLNMNGWKEATVSLWLSVEEHTTYGQVINRGPLATEQPGAFWLAVGPGYGKGHLGFQRSPTRLAVECKNPEAILALKRWYHLMMTYDGTALRYYIDGQLERETPGIERNTPIWDGPDTKLVIGNMSRLPFINWTDMFFNGFIDEVCIFDRALSGNEVKLIYDNQKRPKQQPGG